MAGRLRRDLIISFGTFEINKTPIPCPSQALTPPPLPTLLDTLAWSLLLYCSSKSRRTDLFEAGRAMGDEEGWKRSFQVFVGKGETVPRGRRLDSEFTSLMRLKLYPRDSVGKFAGSARVRLCCCLLPSFTIIHRLVPLLYSAVI